MKNIFGLNKTLYSEEGQEAFDGASFITKSLSNDVDKEEEKSEKAVPKLPIPLSIIQYVCIAAFAIGLGIWLSSGKSMAELIKSSIYVPILLAGGFVGFICMSVIEMINAKKFAKENGIENFSEFEDYGEIHELDEEADAAEEARVRAELEIPEDAIDMDFLSFFYRENESGPFSIKPFDFMTLEMFVFADGESLHIADFNDVYSISKSDIKGIEKIEKETTLLGWSKDDSFDSEKYAEYGITENSEGFIVIPYYYSVRIDANGEEYELVIPPYEMQRLSAILGMDLI